MCGRATWRGWRQWLRHVYETERLRVACVKWEAALLSTRLRAPFVALRRRVHRVRACRALSHHRLRAGLSAWRERAIVLGVSSATKLTTVLARLEQRTRRLGDAPSFAAFHDGRDALASAVARQARRAEPVEERRVVGERVVVANDDNLHRWLVR